MSGSLIKLWRQMPEAIRVVLEVLSGAGSAKNEEEKVMRVVDYLLPPDRGGTRYYVNFSITDDGRIKLLDISNTSMVEIHLNVTADEVVKAKQILYRIATEVVDQLKAERFIAQNLPELGVSTSEAVCKADISFIRKISKEAVSYNKEMHFIALPNAGVAMSYAESLYGPSGYQLIPMEIVKSPDYEASVTPISIKLLNEFPNIFKMVESDVLIHVNAKNERFHKRGDGLLKIEYKPNDKFSKYVRKIEHFIAPRVLGSNYEEELKEKIEIARTAETLINAYGKYLRGRLQVEVPVKEFLSEYTVVVNLDDGGAVFIDLEDLRDAMRSNDKNKIKIVRHIFSKVLKDLPKETFEEVLDNIKYRNLSEDMYNNFIRQYVRSDKITLELDFTDYSVRFDGYKIGFFGLRYPEKTVKEVSSKSVLDKVRELGDEELTAYVANVVAGIGQRKVSDLTPQERKTLLLLRYLDNPRSIASDIASTSAHRPRKIKVRDSGAPTWRGDIPGVDTAEERRLFRKIARLAKAKDVQGLKNIIYTSGEKEEKKESKKKKKRVKASI